MSNFHVNSFAISMGRDLQTDTRDIRLGLILSIEKPSAKST